MATGPMVSGKSRPSRPVRSVAGMGVAMMAAILVLAMPAAPRAATIVNKDKHAHPLTLIERKGVRVQQIEPGAKLDGICVNGCVVRVGKDENAEFQLAGDEMVSIENGVIYFDGLTGSQPARKPAPAFDRNR